MRFYELGSVPYGTSRYTGEFPMDHRWGLPGVHCPTCDASWSGISEAYPSVDLSGLPEAKQLENAWLEEDFQKFERLRQMVRPLVPSWARLIPGTAFGPLVGSARGTFPQIYLLYAWMVIIRREALERLQAEGLRGLKGSRTELRFRQRNSPELLEVELEPHGLLHPDCLPPGKTEPCGTCGGYEFGLPKQPLLDGASLPEHLDVFRLRNCPGFIVINERFADTLHRLGFEEFSLRELPVR
ncbi:SitI6 family double-CXXCG motif immunity protein [Archangium lipolyticum]|uniref:SitI6 family double-CXXCG motif immunity protein n=1 Tax=Archangium lipolyticum TaxID=2970465 RepID=UPI002149DDCC|nr:double-CXXCG motif protein [Archangium lipolyticum]